MAKTERALIIEVATEIFCAGMSFCGPLHYSVEEAVVAATDLIEQVDDHLNPPAG